MARSWWRTGVSGRLLPPRRPEVWAAAARELLADRALLESMGERAREATAGFDDKAHARAMLDVYAQVLGRPQLAMAPEEKAEAAPWPS